MFKKTILTVAVVVGAVSLTGCASKKYVNAEVASAEARTQEQVDSRVNEVESQVEANQVRLDEQELQISELSKTSQDALERAQAAGKLAEGKLVFETVLTDDKVRFGLDQTGLSPEARMAIDEFAERLVAENANVYVEVQGHTDSTGSESYNLKLGQQRADSVLRYLSREHRIPLHRMSAVSYGESAPIDDNGSREGRARNRRVALIVLQ